MLLIDPITPLITMLPTSERAPPLHFVEVTVVGALAGENVDQLVSAIVGEDQRGRSVEWAAEAEFNRRRDTISELVERGLELLDRKDFDLRNMEFNVSTQHLVEYAGGPADPDVDQLAERIDLLR